MSSKTNTVRVRIPKDMSAAAAKAAFERFGEVAEFDTVPGSEPAVICAFFDIRCAAKAVEAYGDDISTFLEQRGCRTAKLAGNVQLEETLLKRVSSIVADPADAANFLVEFFDTRDADRVRANAAAAGTSASAGKAPAPAAAAPSAGRRPAHAKGAAEVPSSRRATSLLPSAATTAPVVIEVCLSGMPNALCNRLCMEAVMEQSGLQGSVLDVTSQAGSPTGTVRALIAGHRAAEQFFAHFHGRQWDPTGATVLAQIVAVRPAATHPTLPAAAPFLPPPGLGMPPGLSMKGGLGAEDGKPGKEVPTDDSTEAASGTSEVDDEVDVLGEEMVAALCR